MPTLADGSTGISEVSWDAGLTRYELTVTGKTYLFNDFVTIITPTCGGNLAPATNSFNTHLVVSFGAGSACVSGGFAYLIYQIG